MSDNIIKAKKLSGAAFLAFPEMSGMLKTELQGRLNFNSKPTAVYGDLLYSRGNVLTLLSEKIPFPPSRHYSPILKSSQCLNF